MALSGTLLVAELVPDPRLHVFYCALVDGNSRQSASLAVGWARFM